MARIVQQEYDFPIHLAPGAKAKISLTIYADEAKMTHSSLPIVAAFDTMHPTILRTLVEASKRPVDPTLPTMSEDAGQ